MRKNETRRMILKLAAVLLSMAVCMAGILICMYYFQSGGNLREVNMRQYAIIDKDEEGRYTALVDVEGIIRDFHLPDPQTTELDLERYPDIQALYSLAFLLEQEEGGYRIATGSTLSSDPAKALKKGGLVLRNTQWTWTEGDMAAAYQKTLSSPRKISLQGYVLCGKNLEGEYLLTVDKERLLKACRWVLPENEEEKKSHRGYEAVMSLGFYVTEVEGGYKVETTSTLSDVVERFSACNVELRDTVWVWTLETIEGLYQSQQAAEPTAVPETPAPSIEPGTPTPSPTPAATSAPTPTPSATPKATAGEPKLLESREDSLTNLYGYDQTALRKAIKSAKEKYYGDSFKSSQVSYNYFMVGKNASAAYGNCFAVVYTVKTTEGTEYLRAEVFNFGKDTDITYKDVYLTTYTSSSKAKSNSAFSKSLYSIYTLTGGSMVFPENAHTDPFTQEGLVFDNSLEEKLTYGDLWSIPADEEFTLLQLLGYARNEIYARSGHKFKDTSSYYTYFSQYAWYQPEKTVSYNDIVKTGRNNIDLIKEIEALIKEG